MSTRHIAPPTECLAAIQRWRCALTAAEVAEETGATYRAAALTLALLAIEGRVKRVQRGAQVSWAVAERSA